MNKPLLLLATNNRGKIQEFQSLLKNLDVELLSPANLHLELYVTEDGQTYAENASQKALAFAGASGLVALSDDTGLEVDALDGKPGLFSHRFSPHPGASDADRRALLLKQLMGRPHPWKARFKAVVVVASPDGQVCLMDGECPGEIIPEERGENGFGYDPIFLIAELGRTMAELSLEEKNLVSHRARAIQKGLPTLKKLLGV